MAIEFSWSIPERHEVVSAITYSTRAKAVLEGRDPDLAILDEIAGEPFATDLQQGLEKLAIAVLDD